MSNMAHGKVSRFLKGAPFFAFFSKQHKHKHDSETSCKIPRRFDAVTVEIDSDQQNSENKVPKISRIWSLSDWGTDSDSDNNDYGSEFPPSPSLYDCGLRSSTTCSELLPEYEAQLLYRPDASPLSPYQDDIEWTMVKRMTASDCNARDRLLLREKLVKDHIIPHLDKASRRALKTNDGLRVNVLDADMGIQFELTLKKWPSTPQCYGLTHDWKTNFAIRRGLRLTDVVGFCWDKQLNQLQFTVLWRSPPLTNCIVGHTESGLSIVL